MDNETKDFLEKMFNHMNNRFDKVEEDINNLSVGQQEIKFLLTELDPKTLIVMWKFQLSLVKYQKKLIY